MNQDMINKYQNRQIWFALISEVKYINVFNNWRTQHYCRAVINRTVENPNVVVPGEDECIEYNKMY
jgi:hypothetical protein